MAHGVIVVDMLRGFFEAGSKLVERWDKTPVIHPHVLYCGDKARDIIIPVFDLLDNTVARGEKIFFICDEHERNDAEFAIFEPHCIRGTKECEIIPELSSFITQNNVIKKNRYSGFFNTNLDEILRGNGITDLTVVGACTDICVMYTVADARNRDYRVQVKRSCVTSFDSVNHVTALHHMKRVLGVTIIKE